MSDAHSIWARGKQFEDDGQFEEALTEYRAAAALGHGRAMNSIGFMTLYGRGVERDVAEAAQWFKRAMQANEPRGFRNMARLLRDGSPKAGIAADRAEAMRLMRVAAEDGLGLAAYDLGEWLKADNKDKKSEAWFARVLAKSQADAARGDPEAQYLLGCCFVYGRGVLKDDHAAFAWFALAADKGHSAAMTMLGCLYEYGSGVTKNAAKANDWYERAATKGERSDVRSRGQLQERSRLLKESAGRGALARACSSRWAQGRE